MPASINRTSPTTVVEHPTMAAQPFVRTNLWNPDDNVVYNLDQTMHRCTWIFDNGGMNAVTYNYIVFGMNHLRFSRRIDWQLMLPDWHGPHIIWTYIGGWLNANAVRADVEMINLLEDEPIADMVMREEDLEFFVGMSDEELMVYVEELENMTDATNFPQ